MEYTIKEVRESINALGRELVSLQDELTELDNKLGDGDLGISMAKGGAAMCGAAEAYQGETLDALFTKCAAAFNRAAPSTLGTLLSMGMRALGKALESQTTVTEAQLIGFPRILANEIALRGKAKPGDKTILDALVPYADAMETWYATSGSLAEAAVHAAEAAQAGAEATKGMLARTGRAHWLGTRNMEYPDGGAVLCSRIASFLMKPHAV